ncbi:MAG: CPBP family intramembrane metalloprotease [Anaerolineae bacterium]|nr:CPBP family intramembrane metalloprotease [Anaerolineae bacterium]
MMTNEIPTETTGKTRFGKTFLALVALGVPGVLALIPTALDQVSALPLEMLDLPVPLTVALALFNSLILLAIAVAVGTLLAHRVGLRSLVAERVRQGAAIWPQLRPYIKLAFVAGIIFAVVVLGLDALINPFAGTELASDSATAETPTIGALLTQLLLGLLYGGIVEELLLRWGVMTLFVWIGWRVAQRGQGAPRPALVWTAIILAALLFGIGHLPAMASMVTLTPRIVVRTILLNAFGGVLFGWLLWRRNLETAMVAHAAGHVGFFIVNVVVALLNLG